MTVVDSALDQQVATGIQGVDHIVSGGLRPKSATLVRGPPGSGKSIFGLHYLAACEDDETGLYVNLGEPEQYIRDTAKDFDLDMESVDFLNLSPTAERFHGSETYTLFEAGEVETPDLVDDIRTEIQSRSPDRVVIDPITEFRYLTPDERQFRTQILGLLDFLKEEGATVVLTSQAAATVPDDDLQFLVDAVISIDHEVHHRSILVSKFRGASVLRGHHTLEITDDGMRVWPQLDPNRHGREYTQTKLPSGVPELDKLLDGGLTTGTVTFLSGPTGVGKTTTGVQFLTAAAQEGRRSVLFSFEEDRRTLLTRAEAIGLPLADQIDRGTIELVEIGPKELSINELTHRLRTEVEDNDAELVMIDGTSGFQRSLRGLGEEPMEHLVAIGRYLRNMGVMGIVSNEVHQITGEFRATEAGTSYLADSILILRHVEHRGTLMKVIGVLKMRTSGFENQLRELEITEDGIRVGDSLPELRGILTGTPNWSNEDD